MRLAVMLSIAVAALGCTSFTPAGLKAKPPEVRGLEGGPVAVVGQHEEPTLLQLNANGVEIEYDRNGFADELARLVAESMSEAGVNVGAGGGTIGVRIVYMDFLFQGPCIVDYGIRYGDGDWLGGQARHESSSFMTACREALEQAASEIASSSRTRSYLENGR